MITNLNINSILVYSEKNNKYFFTEFEDKLNIIYGKNTAGKSTLIQLILYAFGINDNKVKLLEILSEDIFVRLDCSIKKGEVSEKYIFIRENETYFIKESNSKIIKFNGINGNASVEHIKLKKYFNSLFNFDLKLETNDEIKEAPIETIFLPYYISQEVGWVYLRKSFSNLNFYKNFKDDFLDYYLGIENMVDREEKRKIENKIKNLSQQIKFFTSVDKENQELKFSKMINETLTGKANEIIERISNIKNELLISEKEYVKQSNKLTFYVQRLSVVSKVKRNHNKQKPGKDHCPTCTQILPINIEEVYEFYQEENDTTKQQEELKNRIKSTQSKINTNNNKIEEYRKNIKKEYNSFNKYSENQITLDSWINNKANIQLYDNLLKQVGKLKLELENEKEKLKEYKTDDEIIADRNKKSYRFKSIYFNNNIQLSLPSLEDERFYKLYEISNFPFQGVQLHLAVLSYHFAFNKLLTETNDIHRLPFILDSIFNEDIEGGTKEKILTFITKNYPKDTQTILSIADDKNIDTKIDFYSKKFFKDNAHLICIGKGTLEKALLKENDDAKKNLIEDTFEILETV